MRKSPLTTLAGQYARIL